MVASEIPVSFACADLALLGKSERVQQLARRYVGADISDISSVAIDLGDKVPGVYWVNLYRESTATLLRAWLESSPRARDAWSATDLPAGKLMLTRFSDRVAAIDIEARCCSLGGSYLACSQRAACCTFRCEVPTSRRTPSTRGTSYKPCGIVDFSTKYSSIAFARPATHRRGRVDVLKVSLLFVTCEASLASVSHPLRLEFKDATYVM